MYIKRLPPNLLGRDFVCGDIHGSYSCVEKFLKEIHFHPEDRFICVGDLVDRGPDSVKALDLLFMPWFYMVRGNHELMMMDFFNQDPMGMWFLRNGGMWALEYLREQSDVGMHVRDAATKLKELPYLLTVEKKDGGVFHVIHAELFCAPHWPEGVVTDEILADEEALKQFSEIQTNDGDMISWGRHIFMRFYKQVFDERNIGKLKRGAALDKLNRMFNPNLSHIYSGHTIVKRPVQFYGQTNLDTCAYGSYSYQTSHGEEKPDEWCGLTVAEPATGKFWFVNDREFKEVQPVVFQDEDLVPAEACYNASSTPNPTGD
jgi:serine/threonine protein phosphatase 1